MGRFFGFFKDVYGEMQRLVWPSRQQVIRDTITILVFCAVAAVILGAADVGLVRLFDYILSK